MKAASLFSPDDEVLFLSNLHVRSGYGGMDAFRAQKGIPEGADVSIYPRLEFEIQQEQIAEGHLGVVVGMERTWNAALEGYISNKDSYDLGGWFLVSDETENRAIQIRFVEPDLVGMEGLFEDSNARWSLESNFLSEQTDAFPNETSSCFAVRSLAESRKMISAGVHLRLREDVALVYPDREIVTQLAERNRAAGQRLQAEIANEFPVSGASRGAAAVERSVLPHQLYCMLEATDGVIPCVLTQDNEEGSWCASLLAPDGFKLDQRREYRLIRSIPAGVMGLELSESTCAVGNIEFLDGF